MPKAILRWDLSDYDEKDNFEMTLKALDYRLALEDFGNKIRAWDKYSDKETVTIEELRQAFYEILEDHEVEI